MKLISVFLLLLGAVVVFSCSKEIHQQNSETFGNFTSYIRSPYKIKIDSSYAYHGDSLYRSMAKSYFSAPSKTTTSTISLSAKAGSTTKASNLSPEDDAFFSKKHIVRSTEAMLYQGTNYIFPGAILEGNTISSANYSPIWISNRNPVTLSMSLTHTTPKSTRRTFDSPSLSQMRDYVAEMAQGGSFAANQKFMFQQKRFTFYDEIKQAFGTNVDTRKLFSSKQESQTQESHKISQSTGMFIKFFQSSFTVDMDIAPLANQPIQGSSDVPPVYVNSVTFGRMGIIVLETNKEYEFVETCMRKEFDRIFYNKTETLTTEEQLFFEQTELKILIMGSDSDYTVQTVKGYPYFLNLIYNSTFTETSYGVPIACSFSDANTHALIETEFENTTFVEPLFVQLKRENAVYHNDANSNNYTSSAQIFLDFYKNREKTTAAHPYIDVVFEVENSETSCNYQPNYQSWPEISINCDNNFQTAKIRNTGLSSRIPIGTEHSSYTSNGPEPSDPHEPQRDWSAQEYHSDYSLKSSPFFIIVY